MRTFLAIEIDDYIKNKINDTQEIIKNNTDSSIKYVETENIHLTLKFFGEINKQQLNDIIQIVEESIGNYEKYPLKVVNIGAFPNIYRSKVIWTGIKDNKITTNLIKELDEKFNKIGFKKEKNYVPHITIGRVKNSSEGLSECLNDIKKAYHGKMVVKKICIKSSKLTPNGPIYNNIKEFELGVKK